MKIQNGMLCPVCEFGKLAAINKDLNFNYNGHVTSFKRNVYACPECSEEFLDPADQKNIDKHLTDVRRKIDGLLTSNEIKQIRLNFKYTQVEFAKILQVGEKNFARYENGQSTQSRSMDSLLRVLKEYPDAIKIIGGEFYSSLNSNVYDLSVYLSKRKRKQKNYYIKEENFDGKPKTCLSGV